MESQLADLERKIDDLLASVDVPTELVPNPAGEGLRKESDEASSEKERLEKGEEEASRNANMTEKGSK